MSQYKNHANYNCKQVLAGNSADISLAGCSKSQLRADVVLIAYDTLRLWGQVTSCKGYPIEGALVKLVEVERTCQGEACECLAHTWSDCEGFYQFDLRMAQSDACYRVVVERGDPCDGQTAQCACANCEIRTPARTDGTSHCGQAKQMPCNCNCGLLHCSYDYSSRPQD